MRFSSIGARSCSNLISSQSGMVEEPAEHTNNLAMDFVLDGTTNLLCDRSECGREIR